VPPPPASQVLAGRVTDVRASERLVGSPAVMVGHLTESTRQMHKAVLRGLGGETSAAADVLSRGSAALELNRRHPLMIALAAAARSEEPERRERARLVAEQVWDNARIAAGAVDDPREMLARLNDLCQKCLQ